MSARKDSALNVYLAIRLGMTNLLKQSFKINIRDAHKYDSPTLIPSWHFLRFTCWY